jgi:hypothetical protein
MPASLSTSASRPKVKHSTESILFGIDFTKLLQAGETLIGLPSVTLTSLSNPAGSPPVGGNTSPALAIGSPVVNSTAFTNDDGGLVAIGNGVQVRLAAGVSPTDYVLTATCGTTAANTRTVVCTLQVRDQ